MHIDSHNSHRTLVESDILQGSVWGSVLFSIYTQPMGAIFRKYRLQYHRYANDTQMCVDLSGARDGEGADAVCSVEDALKKQL